MWGHHSLSKDFSIFAIQYCLYDIYVYINTFDMLCYKCMQCYLVKRLNLTRICRSAVNRCLVCLRKRLIEKGKYVKREVFTHPRDYRLSLNIGNTSYKLNSTWQIDLIQKLRLRFQISVL